MTFLEFVADMAASIRSGFEAAIRDIVDSVVLAQLTDAIESGDFETMWRLLGVLPGSFRPLTRAIEQTYEDGAQWVAQSYPRIIHTEHGKGVFRFNIHNPRAQEWLRTKSSALITSITDDTRQAVRMTLDEGLLAGRHPRSTALDIVGRYNRAEKRRMGGVVGMTFEQQGWVSSARKRLTQAHMNPEAGERYLSMRLRDGRFDSVVRKAMETGKPLTTEQVDRLVGRYADRTLKYRGDTIARTESMEALSASKYESTRQVVDSGAAREKDVKRTWDATNDNRTRHTHAEMEGQTVGLNEPYVSPSGARLMFPRDRSLGAPASEIIACRCDETIEIDWIGAAIDD